MCIGKGQKRRKVENVFKIRLISVARSCRILIHLKKFVNRNYIFFL
jgi:hypothetical protein